MSCLVGSLRSTEYSRTFVSTAFMELFAGQAIAAGVEVRALPEALKVGPRFFTTCGVVAVDRLDDETHSRALCERGLLVGLEYAVGERCCDHASHVVTSSDESYPVDGLEGRETDLETISSPKRMTPAVPQ
jgi:hypothetical protein